MAEHTPTPWEAQTFGEGEDGIGIIGLPLNGLVAWASMLPTELDAVDPSRAEANAAFIVKAVNNHDALVDALRTLDTLLDFGDDALDNIWTFEDLTSIQAAFDKAKAALDQVTLSDVGGSSNG